MLQGVLYQFLNAYSLCNPKVHDSVPKSLPLDPIACPFSQSHKLGQCVCKLYFVVTFLLPMLMSHKWSVWSPGHNFFVSRACILTISSSRIVYSNIQQKIRIMRLVIV